MTSTRWLPVLAAAAVLVTGCDLVKKIVAEKVAEKAAESSDKSSDKGKGEPSRKESAEDEAKSGCDIPETVKADVTVTKGCVVQLKHTVSVQNGATLKVEPGAKIKVAQDQAINVENGKLVAKGTEKEPIVFTSANSTPSAGDWVGVIYGEKTQGGSALEWVTVEYAGNSNWYGKGAVELRNQKSPGRVSIVSCHITHSAQAGVADGEATGGFAKFERNTLKDNKMSLDVQARVLGSVGAGNVLSDPVHVDGKVDESTTWPAVDVPVFVDSDLDVGGERAPATLTVQPRTVLKFAAAKRLAVGWGNGGGLVANGVTFTSANASPHEADWAGIHIGPHASNVSLDGAVVEYAGKDTWYGKGAITFQGAPAKSLTSVKIANTTFRHNAQSAISSPDDDCGPLATANNKSEDAPLCHPK